jgi:hypothetical protein
MIQWAKNRPIDVLILKIFPPKNVAKILELFARATASFRKNWIIAMVFDKDVIFSAENMEKNCRKF